MHSPTADPNCELKLRGRVIIGCPVMWTGPSCVHEPRRIYTVPSLPSFSVLAEFPLGIWNLAKKDHFLVACRRPRCPLALKEFVACVRSDGAHTGAALPRGMLRLSS